ncbi:hypothetical protein ACQJBY_047540 [Aegilops geniculata]
MFPRSERQMPPAAAPADWSGLHQDILSRIFLSLACIGDRVRFSAVNQHWRGVALENPPPLPWLLMPSTAGTSCHRIFGGFADPQPPLAGAVRGARFCGSSPGGWSVVVLHQWHGHALLNLRSGERVPLPDHVRVTLNGGRAPPNFNVVRCPIMIRAAAVSAPPPSAACVVAALTTGQTTMAFWRPGMDCWSPAPLGAPCDAQDLTYHDGCFWAVNPWEQLFCYRPDISGADGALTVQHLFYQCCADQMTPPAPGEIVSRYLLPAASGEDLLMVKRFVDPARGGTRRFEVFRLEKQLHSTTWRLYKMEGQVLFVGRSCSKAFDTGRSGNPGYIYFLDDVYGGRPMSVLQQNEYPCTDMGGWSCSPDDEEIKRCLPWAHPSDSSPSIWYLH